MQTLPFALSVHHFISSVGADAGFAALIAVALLVLLYFSQARETATLRHRADEAGNRVQDLEAQLAAVAQQVAALPAEISVHAASPKATAAYGNARMPAVVGAPDGLPPAAPAGVGAPALAAATRLIPDPVVQQEAVPVGLVGRPGSDGNGPVPATGAGGNGSARPVAAASAATMKRLVQAPPGGPSRPGMPPRGAQGRPAGARPGGPPRQTMTSTRGSGWTPAGRVLAILAALLGVAAIVVGVIVIKNIHSGTSSSKSSAASAQGTLATRRTTGRTVTVNPATVTVTVLNGTDMTGAAGRVSQELTKVGFVKGSVTNAADQTHTTTIVQYMPNDRRDALAVASELKLHANDVQAIDQATQQIACPPAQGPCKSSVVVTVGSDLAGAASQ